jgi:uncharacterized RDD family membrane protein YckC
MNTQSGISNWHKLLLGSLPCLWVLAPVAHSTALTISDGRSGYESKWSVAAENSPANSPATPTAPAEAIPSATADDLDSLEIHRHRHQRRQGTGSAVVSIGHDSILREGERADDVVAILGSSNSAGEVANSVVSILGNTRVTGPVGDSAVAVLGSVYVDSKVTGDVVAVLGNVELGPNAEVSGNLVAVGGALKRDPAAQVHGDSRAVAVAGNFHGFDALNPWIKHCLMLGRPLAFVPGIGWAWTLALVALAIYALIALLFGSVVDRCAQTLETYPGQSLLTAVLTVIATPIVFVVLVITVIGILVVPFLGFAVLLLQIFGKLVMLAWIGRRVTTAAPAAVSSRTAVAVLVGGLIVMALYTVPVLGFIMYKLLGVIGTGAVIYTLLLAMQGRRATRVEVSVGAAAPEAAVRPVPSPAPPGVADTPFTQESHSTPEPQAQAPPVPPSGGRSTRVPAASAVALPRAGFWIRMVALLFDAIIVAVVLHLLQDSSRLFLVFLAAYGAIMWKLRGSTVGGIIFNLQVVQHDGREMDWSTAIVRALSSFLSLIAIGLGFIWIAVDPESRAWHDKIAGTIVVRVP